MSTVANRITIKRLHPHFVAEVTGIDCSAPMSQEDFRTIWEGFNEHQILVFRDQHFQDESQIAFSSKFNQLETMIAHPGNDWNPGHISVMTNLGKDGDFLKAPWELYDLDNDFSQADDLAAKNPEKLKELQTLFLKEAKKYGVFPLDPRLAERFDPRNRLADEPKTSWTYYGNNVRLPEPVGPIIYPNSHAITAELTVPDKGCEGVIMCCGGIGGGWSLYVKDGKPAYHYNFADFEYYDVAGKDALPSGKVTLKLEYISKGTPKGSTISNGAVVKLYVNGKVVAEGTTERAMFRHGIEPFEIGRDSISPVDAAYKSKGDFAFTGKIEKITFEATPLKK